MKTSTQLLLLTGVLLMATRASAQISVDRVEEPAEDIAFRDSLKSSDVDSEYFNLARYRAERAAIRKERNTLEITAGVQGTLTSYNDPWIQTSGGDNTIALNAVFDLKHTFTKNKFTIDTRAIAKFGYNRMKVEYDDHNKGMWFKNQDEIEISTAPKFKMTKNWSYGSIIKFRSQFANGYKSRTEQESKDRKSSFMTPGYLDVSLGFTYTCPKPKFPIVITLAPLALNATFAESKLIRDNGFTYGIEDPNNTSKYEGGSSIQLDFDRKFGKTEYLRYRTMFYTFYGWISDMDQRNRYCMYDNYKEARDQWIAAGKPISEKPRLAIHPIVRWTNIIDIKATKYLSTQISFELYYNRAQCLDVQLKTLLSVGLTYTFKNK